MSENIKHPDALVTLAVKLCSAGGTAWGVTPVLAPSVRPLDLGIRGLSEYCKALRESARWKRELPMRDSSGHALEVEQLSGDGEASSVDSMRPTRLDPTLG